MWEEVKNMNRILIAIGIVVAILGVIAGALVITTPQLFGLINTESTPYAQYMIPLIVGGLVLVIVGAVIPSKKMEDKK
jgi:ABC-type transport system involved in cytochrome c biogenesis permease component